MDRWTDRSIDRVVESFTRRVESRGQGAQGASLAEDIAAGLPETCREGPWKSGFRTRGFLFSAASGSCDADRRGASAILSRTDSNLQPQATFTSSSTCTREPGENGEGRCIRGSDRSLKADGSKHRGKSGISRVSEN